MLATVFSASLFATTACNGGKTENSSSNNQQTVDFEISQTTLKMLIGTEEFLSCVGGTNVVWSSSNEAVVTVEDGILFGVSAGTAVITATSGKETKTCSVSVVKSFTESDYLVFESLYAQSAYVGLQFTLGGYLVIDDQPLDDAAISYATSNAEVIKVDGNVAQVLSVGECVLTATASYADKEYTQTLSFKTVDEYAAIVFEAMGTRTAMVLGQELTLDCRVFVNGNQSEEVAVEWSSTAPNVVSVENGKCTATEEGEAIIKAKYKNAEKILYVNVYENYLHKFIDEESIIGIKGTKTSWGASVAPTLEIVKGAVEGRTPDQGAFLKFSYTEDQAIYSLGMTLTKAVNVETMKMLAAYGFTEVVIPVWTTSRAEIGCSDGSFNRGNNTVQGGVWTEVIYKLSEFASWCELNEGNFNQSQDKPFMFLITNAAEFTMYVDSIYVR